MRRGNGGRAWKHRVIRRRFVGREHVAREHFESREQGAEDPGQRGTDPLERNGVRNGVRIDRELPIHTNDGAARVGGRGIAHGDVALDILAAWSNHHEGPVGGVRRLGGGLGRRLGGGVLHRTLS